MNNDTYNTVMKTLDHVIEMFKDKPDRKGALQDVQRLQNHFEMECNVKPKVRDILVSCGAVATFWLLFVVTP